MRVLAHTQRTKIVNAEMIAIFRELFLKIKPKLRDVLAKMRECKIMISHTIAGRLTHNMCSNWIWIGEGCTD